MVVEETIGSTFWHSEIVEINDCMHVCGMEDIKSVGNLYTWNNKQHGTARVLSKLYRVLDNEAWQGYYPSVMVVS